MIHKFPPLFRLALCCLLLAAAGAGFRPLSAGDDAGDAPATASSEAPSSAASEPTDAERPARKPALHRFSLREVETLARALSVTPYDAASNAVPEHLQRLSLDQWRALRIKPEHVLWKDEGLPFAIGLFHPGYIFNRSAEINVVDESGVTKIPFSADMFETDNESLTEQIRSTLIGFAGFQLLAPDESAEDAFGRNSNNRLAGFMGASTFMFKGRNSRLGSSSRPIALDTALPSGEIFPYFREFWLVKPQPDATSFTLYALMDSPGLTGAYQMEIIPGTSAVINIDARLFRRAGAAPPEKLGLTPLSSMYLYSETTGPRNGDYRPEVHNADGLLLANGGDSWLWRPLTNNERLVVSDFKLANPRGFGLMQRDNNFDHYQDIEARYDRRTSIWVEPKGDWGEGKLELIEIPAARDFHSNVVAFWIPENAETAIGAAKPGDAAASAASDPLAEVTPYLAYAYTMYWMPPGASPHALGLATDTRMLRSADGEEATFIVEFGGGELDSLEADFGLTSVVEAPEQAPLLEKTLHKNPGTDGWRLIMRFRLPKNGMLQRLLAARDGPTGLRFKAHLKKGENISEPLTETWVYDLVP